MCLATSSFRGGGVVGSPDVWVLPKVFTITAKHTPSEFTTPVITSNTVGGEHLARPLEAQELGLTDSVWDMTLRCRHQDPAQRPMMVEVVGLLRELVVSSPPIETDLYDFFQACEIRGKDDQAKKAQEFADGLDEVRHTGRHNIRSPYHTSRFSTKQIFTNKNAHII